VASEAAEYIYTVWTGGLGGRGVYILRPGWWLERPRSIYTPSRLVASEAAEYIYSVRTESVKELMKFEPI
jgi:hypothetical protein